MGSCLFSAFLMLSDIGIKTPATMKLLQFNVSFLSHAGFPSIHHPQKYVFFFSWNIRQMLGVSWGRGLYWAWPTGSLKGHQKRRKRKGKEETEKGNKKDGKREGRHSGADLILHGECGRRWRTLFYAEKQHLTFCGRLRQKKNAPNCAN